ncbi:MAG: hypothetical protein B7Z23_03395, partial [Pseudomonadales bacterium 32-61-5]
MTSGDNLPLQANYKNEVTFIPNPPYLAAPTFINAQLAKGDANYEFSAANVKQVRVRAKRLNGPELLKALDQYRAYRTAYYGNDKQKAAYKTQSIDTYPGTQVFDRSFPVNKPLDHSEILKLNWREVLGDFPAAPLFIELEGTAADGIEQKGVVTQTLVQFTDLGIMLSESLSNIGNDLGREPKTISAAEAVDILQARMNEAFPDDQAVRVFESDGIVADAAAGADYIKIRSDALFNQRDLNILAVHEGMVHVATSLNGQHQPICTFLAK